MDPTDSCRIVEPSSLKLPPEPLPFKAPSRILPPRVHPIPVNSLVGREAYFSEIERVEHIGSGTVGAVYKAVHRPSGRLHAIKVISECSNERRCQILQRFEGLDGVVEHPNVVSCWGVHDSDGEIQVLLDYVDGRSLVGVHIQDEQRLSRLTLQILSGLAHLHKSNVVHQNIKPSNLLVDSLLNVKIGDWMARIVVGRSSSCRISAYMSPEITGGDYRGYAGDIWSLGICILETYLGSSPYGSEQLEPVQLLFKIFNREPPQAPPSASIEFRDFISRCLQKDPSKRWTAAQLLRHPFILQHNHQTASSVDKRMKDVLLGAQYRWLKPAEVLLVLQNYEKFQLAKFLPHCPPSGSMFLYDRNILGSFPVDGHDWREKDQQTVKEEDQPTKVGNGEMLCCSYSQAEKNPNFWRRLYWVSDEKRNRIVLVHYREVKEKVKQRKVTICHHLFQGEQKSVSLEDSATMSRSTITCGSSISFHSDSLCKPSDTEHKCISQRERNINIQNERTTSYRGEISDRTQHPDSQCNAISGERFVDELASLELPTCQDWKGRVTPIHGAEECKMEINTDINYQDQKEDVSMLEDDNKKVILSEEFKPGMMVMRSIEESNDKQNSLEERPNSHTGMEHIETDSCYTDSDAEDATVTRGQKHRKLKASESFHEVPNSIQELHMQSTPSSAIEERCLPISMPTNANADIKKTEVLRGCAQTDDFLNRGLLHQKTDEVPSVEIQKMAKQIVKQIVRACGNDFRPLTLMSRALSNVLDIETWEYALAYLSLQHASCLDDSENLQVNVLRFSIELLEDDLTRECLRSFALNNMNVEVARASLIDSLIKEGILVMHTEGEKVIKNLLDAKLLELSEHGELVMFLDLDQHVLDLVFQLDASGEFLMQGGLGLVDPPEVGEWERAKEICLMHNDLSELPENPRCPSLLTLFLQRNHKLRTIPASFFSHMPALEVLNLSRTRIKSLPDSLFDLVSLKRLFLNECILLRALSPKVGGLKNLEVLDLEGTKLMGLPEEIKQLIKLTCLEVSIFGEISKVTKQINALIPSGALSALSLLEELNIDVGPEAEWWESYVEGLLDEICSLKRLSGLKFYFPKVEPLGKFSAAYLTHFRIVVGRQIGRIMSRLPTDIEFELERWDRYLKYICGEGILEEVMKVLKHADAFFLDRHTDLKKLSDLGKENLEQLRCCILGECNELRVLIDVEDFKGQGDKITLGSLEYLYVYYMKNLETFWRGPVQKGSLSCLKSLTLRTCPKVTSIFTRELLENLCNLEELTVEDCPALISLVSCKHSTTNETSYYLPVLKKMSLHYLPELTSISSGPQVAPKIEWLSFYDCPNLKSLDLSVQEVKTIRSERIWWEGLEWNGDCVGLLGDIFTPITACTVP